MTSSIQLKGCKILNISNIYLYGIYVIFWGKYVTIYDTRKDYGDDNLYQIQSFAKIPSQVYADGSAGTNFNEYWELKTLAIAS